MENETTVLVNQVGYDCNMPKKIVVQSRLDFGKHSARYELIDLTLDQSVYSGELPYWGRVNQGNKDDWGYYYWTGEFSDFSTPGLYKIGISIGNKTVESFRFEIEQNLLWNRIAPLAFSYYRNSRNTIENFDPSEQQDYRQRMKRGYKSNGLLEDDRNYYDVDGAWFEFGTHGGTFMRDAAKVMFSILSALERDSMNIAAWEELDWASEWWRKIMIHYPDSGRIISSMGGWHQDDGNIAWYDAPFGLHQHFKFMSLYIYARIYQLTGKKTFLERGELMWDFYSSWPETDKIFSVYFSTGQSQEADGIAYNASWQEPRINYTKVDDAAFLFGDTEMYIATKNDRYLKHAENMIDNILSEIDDDDSYYLHWNNNYTHMHPSALAYFAKKLPTNRKAAIIRDRLERFLDIMIADSKDSPFGIAKKNFAYYETWNPNGTLPDTSRDFFNHSEEGKGVNPEYGLEVWQSLMINSIVPKPDYKTFAGDHLNWILGLNPRNICMLKGVGSNTPVMTPGGIHDGCVCHGLVADHQLDKPWFGLWQDSTLDWHKDTIAGHKIWAQSEALIRGTACLMMGLGLLR